MKKRENNIRPKLDTIILKTATNYLLPLLIMFSLFVLIRGHYLSGGGFVGGLIASIAFVLHSFAYNTKRTISLFRFRPLYLIPMGLSLSLFSGLLPFLISKPFMTSIWFLDSVAVIGAFGSALLFDLGVYLVVIGVVLTIIFTISENV
ncbi:Na+/H+ antiporter subunit B [Paenimyroides tangerinum]|uniref:Na+/H+ antiporter subunit B n=1 Tax=Paenimyroides tangerinum TaxID=2488728 RepID=A0A3P3W4V5_9FLAO|nr:Na+/H+ antiporter subunit B [Paenimyroides tangerinum]RRJ90141.1 Na+/H+ antiporter subunit B [Paenimyroides tangerinum]